MSGSWSENFPTRIAHSIAAYPNPKTKLPRRAARIKFINGLHFHDTSTDCIAGQLQSLRGL